MQVIKDKAIIQDDWQLNTDLLSEDPISEQACQQYTIVPFSYWQAHAEVLIEHVKGKPYGVLLTGNTLLDEVVPYLSYFNLIALEFPLLKDGRCYSHARMLRQRHHYQGELRAVGDILRDQIFFMYRCGIDSFKIREDKDIEDALSAFQDFSVRYQAATDDAVPIYNLRS